MGDEGDDLVRRSFGNNFDRLTSIKQRYDPGNLFRFNQNITTGLTQAAIGSGESPEDALDQIESVTRTGGR